MKLAGIYSDISKYVDILSVITERRDKMNIGDVINAAKAINLTDEQKQTVKKVVKEAAGNKAVIVSELNKRGIKITDSQVDMVVGLVDKM